ncbi:MAG: cysteine desulfurase family protein [Thermodesulfobacteriota bacterium]
MGYIYLDNNATTQVDPEVTREMLPCLEELYANPSGTHTPGKQAREKINIARERVAGGLDCSPGEIVFTSCGTEGDNAAINAALHAEPDKKHLVTTRVEHPAVLNYCRMLEDKGYSITYLDVDSEGNLDTEQLRESLTADTALVSIMYANNETGVEFPLSRIAQIVKERDILLHTDAVQAVGKTRISMQEIPVDYLTLSGHKLHAPKGIGALFVRRDSPFSPFIIGGSQESGRRGGTESTPFIVALGKAIELAANNLEQESSRIKDLRDYMEDRILESIPDTRINGDRNNRLPNTSSLAFRDVVGEDAVLELDRHMICASAGAACKAGSLEPSPVLKAMGIPFHYAKGSLRLSLSRFTTARDIDFLLQKLPGIVQEMRK